MADEKETTPYGSVPVDQPDTLEPVEEVAQEEAPAAEEQQPGESKVDYEKRYAELQKKFGEHSNVVGELRKQNQALAQEVEAIKKQAVTREEKARNMPPPTDYEKMLGDIAKRADEGEISLQEALLQSNKITREWSKAEAEQEKQSLLEQARGEVQTLLSEKDAQRVIDKFHEANPDFVAMRDAGKFDELKASDPLLDDLSAFWKAKAVEAQALAEARFEEGKKEALRVAAGSEKAGKVLSDPGKSMQTQQKPRGPVGENDIKASMLATLAGKP